MSQNHLERIEALERRIEELERRIQDLERRSGPKVFTPHSSGLTERYRRKGAVREVLWRASLVPKVIPQRPPKQVLHDDRVTKGVLPKPLLSTLGGWNKASLRFPR